MRPEQVDLIRKSFDAMWPIRRDIADLCYSRFFELAPDARDRFAGDMERQRVKLMDMIAALVGSLDEHPLFQSMVTNSGRTHARFGVQPSQYVAMGEALMWSLDASSVRRSPRSCGKPGGHSTPQCRSRCSARP
jgi:hemoglobin-like flavoprotein